MEERKNDEINTYDISKKQKNGWGTLRTTNLRFQTEILSDSSIQIGTDPITCKVVVSDVRVNKQHCVQKYTDLSSVRLTNLSNLCTYVNEEKVGENESIEIQNSDIISLLDQQNMIYEDKGPTYVFQFNSSIFKRQKISKIDENCIDEEEIISEKNTSNVNKINNSKKTYNLRRKRLCFPVLDSIQSDDEVNNKDQFLSEKPESKKILHNDNNYISNELIQSNDSKSNKNLIKEKIDHSSLSQELICAICLDLIYQCVTLMPCLHNLCGSCVSELVNHSKNCPMCKCEIKEAKMNPLMNNIIQDFVNKNPTYKKTSEEMKSIDSRNKFKDGNIVSISTITNNSRRANRSNIGRGYNYNFLESTNNLRRRIPTLLNPQSSDEEELEIPIECPECTVPRTLGGHFMCSEATEHLQCNGCSKYFPDRNSGTYYPDQTPVSCVICLKNYCNLYFFSNNRCDGQIKYIYFFKVKHQIEEIE